MTRKNTDHLLDEKFAVAADEFFAGRLENIDTDDEELSALLDTLQSVDEAFKDHNQDKMEAKERIRKNIHKTWFVGQEQKIAQRTKFSIRLQDFFWKNKTQTWLAFSFAIILLALAIVPFLLNTNPDMAATAGQMNPSKISLLIVFGMICISALVWVLKRKQ